MFVAWTPNDTSHGVHSTVCIMGPSICNVFIYVHFCTYVSGISGQFLVPKTRLYISSHLYIVILWSVDSSWVRGRERWASWEMRQCTIMCSPYLHGNRNGRAEAHIRSRSHAQTEYDETKSQPTTCLITHHTETHTVTTCLSLTLSDGHNKRGGQRHNDTNPTPCKHSEREKLEMSTACTASPLI